MTNYLLIYTGGDPPGPDTDFSVVLKAWEDWFASIGANLVDRGKPTGPALTVLKTGEVTGGATSGVGGYTIISASSLQEAVEIARRSPHLGDGGSVEVHETATPGA